MTTKTDEIIEQALVQAGETALGEVIDFDDFDLPSDGTETIKARFPELKIVQGTSSMPNAGKHGGDFYHTGREEFLSISPEVVVLQSQYGRALFGDGPAPLCSSANGVNPRPHQALWQRESFTTKAGTVVEVPAEEPYACATCLFSQFVNGNAPLCSEGYLALVDLACDPLAPDLATMRFARTSLKPFRQFIGAIKAMKFNRTSKRVGMPSFAFKACLTTAETAREGKKWYQLAIEKERLPDAVIADYAVFVREVRDAFNEHAQAVEFEDEPPAAAPVEWGDGSESYARQEDGWAE